MCLSKSKLEPVYRPALVNEINLQKVQMSIHGFKKNESQLLDKLLFYERLRTLKDIAKEYVIGPIITSPPAELYDEIHYIEKKLGLDMFVKKTNKPRKFI